MYGCAAHPLLYGLLIGGLGFMQAVGRHEGIGVAIGSAIILFAVTVVFGYVLQMGLRP